MPPVISIQYLRAIAAILVLILHACYKVTVYTGEKYTFGGGNAGVDIFFIISGFIMAYTFRSDLSAHRFLWHRFLRVIPLYWLTTAVALLGYLMFPNLVNGGRESAIISSFLLTPSELPYLNQNGWTLSYEFLFYLLFSLAFLLNRKYNLLTVFGLICCLPLLGYIIQQFSDMGEGVWGEFLFHTIVIEFALGLLLFYLYGWLNLAHRARPVTAVLALLLGLVALLKPWGYPVFHIRLIDLGLPAFFLSLSILSLEKWLKEKPSLLLLNLGNSSYSLYLVHAFVLSGGSVVLLKLNFVSSAPLFLLVIVLLSIIAGEACYQWLEKPMAKSLKDYK